MNKLLVAVFPTHALALQGQSALTTLDANDNIDLGSSLVIQKLEDGTITTNNNIDPNTTPAISFGAVTGALIGLLAGPVGVVAGLALGGLSGKLADLSDNGIDSDFIDEVSAQLVAGRSALIANIDEDHKAPVTNALEDLDAIVFRALFDESKEDRLLREANSSSKELDHSREELVVTTEPKFVAIINKHIESVLAKRLILSAQVSAQQILVKTSYDAQIAEYKEKLIDAGSFNTNRLNKKIDQAINDRDSRLTTLSSAVLALV